VTQASADDAARLERRARDVLAAGSAGRSVQLALDQLIADRTNGEPLDTACRFLRDALSLAEVGQQAETGERRPPT
jgi:hypothetical protein